MTPKSGWSRPNQYQTKPLLLKLKPISPKTSCQQLTMMTTAPYSRKNNGPSNMFMPPPETATAEQPQQQQPFKRCSVPGCPTRGEVDETGTCSAHGTKRKRCKIEGCPNGEFYIAFWACAAIPYAVLVLAMSHA
jgi:hypothetical protein